MKVAHEAARAHEGREIVKPGELVDVTFRKGQSPSLAARRTLSVLIGAAAGDAWKDTTHRVTKAALRGSHESNDRIGPWLDEVAAIGLTLPTISSRGRAAIERAGLFSVLTEETDDDSAAWVEFQFSPAARRLFGASAKFAAMNRAALFAFESKYTVTLYELGCLLVGRKDKTWRGTIPDLRAKLGVEVGKYGDYAQMKRRVLDPAKTELDHLAHFTVTWREKRQGRKVTEIELTFWPKERDEVNAAADECERPRVGRKARRSGTVERVAAKGAAIRAEIAASLPSPSPSDYLDDEIPE
ncbi:MAG: replication initiation protein [Alphaproteobacteria bacterium]|nr:replication initiation protein [Alphaproteobacteria bacterium]MBF0335477.1 replication initiation protein [Alphaproteobacteria bacterium]